MKTRINYREYITSADWLKKKSELVTIYQSQDWPVECAICGSENDLQVHHKDYKEVGNEDLSEQASKAGRGVWQLEFLCRSCHKSWHFDPIWRKGQEERRHAEFIQAISTFK